MLRKILCFTILIGLSGLATAFPDIPFLESGLPQGDYQNQCSECQVVDNNLSCLCDTPKGYSFPRTLDLSLCSLPLVSVKNGRLHCETDLGVIPDDIEDTLVEPEVVPLQSDPEKKLPEGNYRAYCQECSVSNNVLGCSCKIPGWFSDSWYQSSLPLLSCSNKDKVVFSGGQLFCSIEEMIDFHGLKKSNEHDNSCSDCYFSGSTLLCKCNKTKCGWSSKDFDKELNINKAAYLNSAASCTGKINNCNGKLRCGECWAYDYFDQGEWNRPHSSSHTKYGYCYPNAIR